MTKPRQHLIDAFHPRPLRQCRARDHDHGQRELARRIDLGARAAAARIARDQKFDPARTHQLAVAFEREWPARDDDLRIWQWQRAVGRVDKAQRIGVLWLGAKGREMLSADGEKDARALRGQGGDGRVDIRRLDPLVASRAQPWRAFQRQQGNARFRASFDRVAAHLGSKGMRRVDHMCDALLADEVGKTLHAAEAADPRRQRMRQRNSGPPGIRINRLDLRPRESVGKLVGLARSAQNEGAHD